MIQIRIVDSDEELSIIDNRYRVLMRPQRDSPQQVFRLERVRKRRLWGFLRRSGTPCQYQQNKQSTQWRTEEILPRRALPF